jgi:integrase
VGFHDLRHYFCSVCVMAGIDFMTIAAWLGHKDGGILVGKVYGHLLDEHRSKAARLVHFGISAAALQISNVKAESPEMLRQIF